MDGFDAEFQLGELEKQIKSTARADLSVADGADSVYGNTTRAESREPRAESREPRAESREPRVMASALVMFAGALDAPAEPMRTPPAA